MKKTIFSLGIILLINTMDAQWNPTGSTSTNSDINIGGMQFGRFHVKYNIQPLSVWSENLASNGHQNILSLSKEVGSTLGVWPNPSPSVNAIPTWGFSIDNGDKRLRFTYTDLFNQPSTTWSWNNWPNPPTPVLSWPSVTEVFSINTTNVISLVDLEVKKNLSVSNNLSVNGEFRIKDASGVNQFLIDNAGYVRAREVKVDFQYIPDYVFRPDYKLMSLKDLEKYIGENKHLPNIKSEQQYNKEEGVNLGELNLKLLEKVEELTLYLIQQQKEIEELKKIVKK
jgi:hypothetical protein